MGCRGARRENLDAGLPQLSLLARQTLRVEIGPDHVREYRQLPTFRSRCLDSFAESARSIIENISFYTPPFCSALRDYPSHFHINVKPGFQGQGVGRLLLARFVQLCRDRASPGVHVVTGATSRAITFYRMCGFAPFAIPDADPGLAVLVYATPAP